MPLTMIVAAIITRKPMTTENTFDFALSFASALTGKTMIRPIQTITPMARTLVTICTRRITAAVIVLKSDPDFVTERSKFVTDFTPMLGLQFLNT